MSAAARIAVAGEALFDLIAEGDASLRPLPGGAAFNLARALARQGQRVHYLNPLSGDRFGRRLRAALVDDGVELARPDPVAAPTALAVVALDGSGHPEYAFYRDGVADRAIDADSLVAACATAPVPDVVCTGALALDARDAAVYGPWLRAQRAAGRCVVVDANLRPSVMPDLAAYRASVLDALGHAHVVKVSDEDLAHLGIDGATPLDQARALARRTGAQLLALTLGAEGAWLLPRAGDACFHRELRPLSVVDTVGAGDSFLAGLLATLLDGAPDADALRTRLERPDAGRLQEALRVAVACASLVVQRAGCDPPRRDEALAFLAQAPRGVTQDVSR